MLANLKSELRKIYSIRSTYVLILFALATMLFFAFYTEGIKAGANSKAIDDPTKLATLIRDAVSSLAFFGALVGILSVTHEYRYNIIMYTLTISRSRTKALIAKLAAVSIFALLFTIFVTVFAVGFMYAGLAIKGLSLAHQVVPTDLWWRVLLLGWGTCMVGMLIAVYIRQQVGTIAAYFVLPGLGEMLAGLLLKDNRTYLPFTALQQILTSEGMGLSKPLTPSKAAGVFGLYMVVGWLIAWVLFMRRDAN